MTTFEERQDLFEKRFAHDQALQFKAEARRARLFGAWVAERLGLEGEEAKTYAGDVVVSDLKAAGPGDMLRKVTSDLEAKGIGVPEAELNDMLENLLTEARKQVAQEAG